MVTALLVLALTTLASARVTRALVVDRIGQPLRSAIVNWRGESSSLTYLWHCNWCMGLWVSAALVSAVWWPAQLADRIGVTTWAALPLTAIAAAHVVGLILTREEGR